MVDCISNVEEGQVLGWSKMRYEGFPGVMVGLALRMSVELHTAGPIPKHLVPSGRLSIYNVAMSLPPA